MIEITGECQRFVQFADVLAALPTAVKAVGCAVRSGGTVTATDRHPRPSGEQVDRLRKVQVLYLLNKAKHVTTLFAAKAMKVLPFHVDVKRGRFLCMKGAECLVASSRSQQRYAVLSDHVFQGKTVTNIFFFALGYHSARTRAT